MGRLIQMEQQIKGSQVPQKDRKKAEQKVNSKKKKGNPSHA